MKLILLFLFCLCFSCQGILVLFNINADSSVDMLHFTGCSVGIDFDNPAERVFYTLSATFEPVLTMPDKQFFTIRRFDARIYSDIYRMNLIDHIQQVPLAPGRYSEEEIHRQVFGYGWIDGYSFESIRSTRFTGRTSLMIIPEPSTLLLLGAGLLCLRVKGGEYERA